MRLLVFLALLLMSGRAAADEVKHFTSPIHVTTPSGKTLDLPPGYYLPESTWNRLDAEMRRLQDQETRLTAENKSLRHSVEDMPGWKWIAGALVIGIAVGAGGVAYYF